MRISKVKERDIKVNLKKIYKIECTMPEIKRIIDNIPITYEKYTEIEKRKILYLYSEFVNTEKLLGEQRFRAVVLRRGINGAQSSAHEANAVNRYFLIVVSFISWPFWNNVWRCRPVRPTTVGRSK